jgi:hypothetical protein
MMGQPIENLPNLRTPPAAELLLPGPPVWIYRLTGAIPRAAIYRWSDADAASATRNPSGDLSTIDTLATYDRLVSLPPLDDSAIVKIESYAPDSVELVTTSTAAGLLVLHDLYYPGWIAEVDGKEAALLRAGLLFRAVVVPAGHHRVAFRFEPFALSNLSAALTGSGPRMRARYKQSSAGFIYPSATSRAASKQRRCRLQNSANQNRLFLFLSTRGAHPDRQLRGAGMRWTRNDRARTFRSRGRTAFCGRRSRVVLASRS